MNFQLAGSVSKRDDFDVRPTNANSFQSWDTALGLHAR